MNEKVKGAEVLRPEVQGSEDRGGSPFESDDVLYDDSASNEALEFAVVTGRYENLPLCRYTGNCSCPFSAVDSWGIQKQEGGITISNKSRSSRAGFFPWLANDKDWSCVCWCSEVRSKYVSITVGYFGVLLGTWWVMGCGE